MSGGEDGGTPAFALRYRLRRERRRYTAAEVRTLERDRPGVYALWLPSAAAAGAWECLYVGKSERCVRRRLLDHLGEEGNPGLRRALRDLGGVARFSAAYTASREETDALETAMIGEWRPTANRNKLGGGR